MVTASSISDPLVPNWAGNASPITTESEAGDGIDSLESDFSSPADSKNSSLFLRKEKCLDLNFSKMDLYLKSNTL